MVVFAAVVRRDDVGDPVQVDESEVGEAFRCW